MTMQNQDSRLKKSAGDERAVRANKDRPITENRQLTDRERAEAYRQSHYKTHLPDLPPIKGFRVFWATTTNPSDTIQHRARLGYVPIQASEIPGFEHLSLKSGEWLGCIGVNEMVALKLPEHLFEQYMTISHHEEPLLEEQNIVDKVQEGTANSQGVIKNVELFEGTQALGKGPAAPRFSQD